MGDHTLFFVYGTLMQYSGRMNAFSPKAQYLNDILIEGYRLYSLGGFPGLTRGGPGDYVKGELWRVPNSDIPKLDRYESEGYLYLRQQINDDDGDEPIYAYIYNHDTSSHTRIESGDWLAYQAKRPLPAAYSTGAD